MLARAFDFPTSHEGWYKTVGIGGGLLLVSPLVLGLTIVPVLGYLTRSARASVRQADSSPTFERWDELVRDGLGLLGAVLVYTAVAVALALAALAVATVGGRTVGVRTAGWVADVFVWLYGTGVAVAFLYTLPIALTRFAVTGRVTAVLDFRPIWSVAASADYLGPWLLATVLAFMILPFVLPFYVVAVGAFLSFYLSVVLLDVVAGGYREAVTGEEEPIGDATLAPRGTPGIGRPSE